MNKALNGCSCVTQFLSTLIHIKNSTWIEIMDMIKYSSLRWLVICIHSNVQCYAWFTSHATANIYNFHKHTLATIKITWPRKQKISPSSSLKCFILAFWTHSMDAYSRKNDEFFSLFMFANNFRQFSAKCQILQLKYTGIRLRLPWNTELAINRNDLRLIILLNTVHWQDKRGARCCIRQFQRAENRIYCRPLEVFSLFAI